MSTAKLPLGAILGLGVTQIIGYGTLYYSFGILAPDMAHDFGLGVEWIFGALSAALLIGGLVSPWLGRWIDRFGAGRIMTVGSTAASLALMACAAAPNSPTFVGSLIAIQVAAIFVQYGAAFALLVQMSPNTASRSITYLPLIAGFASTIFWPVTTALHASLSWQQVYLVFAGMPTNDSVAISIWFNPLVIWVWIGGIVMAFGGLIVMWPQATVRARQGGYVAELPSAASEKTLVGAGV